MSSLDCLNLSGSRRNALSWSSVHDCPFRCPSPPLGQPVPASSFMKCADVNKRLSFPQIESLGTVETTSFRPIGFNMAVWPRPRTMQSRAHGYYTLRTTPLLLSARQGMRSLTSHIPSMLTPSERETLYPTSAKSLQALPPGFR